MTSLLLILSGSFIDKGYPNLDIIRSLLDNLRLNLTELSGSNHEQQVFGSVYRWVVLNHLLILLITIFLQREVTSKSTIPGPMNEKLLSDLAKNRFL